MKPTRAEFLRQVLDLMGVPYVYGGRSDAGVDCSGLVAVALYKASKGAVDASSYWSVRLWNELPVVVTPKPGDLAFYGGAGTEVTHVVVVVCPEGTPGVETGLIVGANGGGPACKDEVTAKLIGACVMPRPAIRYRNDFRGHRSMAPFLREKL